MEETDPAKRRGEMGTPSTERTIRVLAINGSPHTSGNTATLMRWVAEGAEAAGATVDWVHLSDASLAYCRGCNECLRTGTCVLSDDLQSILRRLRRSGGLIVGSPVYAGQMTAQLKTLADRLTNLSLYGGILAEHWIVGVATSGIAPARPLARRLASFFGPASSALGARTVSLRHGQRALSERTHPRLVSSARRAGRRLVRDIEGGRRVPPLKSVWISFLRRRVLPRLVHRDPESFAAILAMWEENGRK